MPFFAIDPRHPAALFPQSADQPQTRAIQGRRSLDGTYAYPVSREGIPPIVTWALPALHALSPHTTYTFSGTGVPHRFFGVILSTKGSSLHPMRQCVRSSTTYPPLSEAVGEKDMSGESIFTASPEGL